MILQQQHRDSFRFNVVENQFYLEKKYQSFFDQFGFIFILFFFAIFFLLSLELAHPHYFNQLSCGLDIVSLAGEWLTAAANTNM